MPNKIVGKLCHLGISSINYFRKVVKNSVNYYALNTLEAPFNIHPSVEFRNPQQIQFSSSCSILAGTIINGRSTIRECGINFGVDIYLKERCYFDAYGGFIEVEGQCAFAQDTYIHGGGGVTIGVNVVVGPYCCIVASNHCFGSREYPTMLQGDRCLGIKIGNNVWLGSHVTILDGVVIGDNCVIGAGTIVTGNVNPNTLVVNNRRQQTRRIYQND